jgi:hypothetical protein
MYDGELYALECERKRRERLLGRGGFYNYVYLNLSGNCLTIPL